MISWASWSWVSFWAFLAREGDGKQNHHRWQLKGSQDFPQVYSNYLVIFLFIFGLFMFHWSLTQFGVDNNLPSSKLPSLFFLVYICCSHKVGDDVFIRCMDVFVFKVGKCGSKVPCHDHSPILATKGGIIIFIFLISSVTR